MKNLSKLISIVIHLYDAFKSWELFKRKEDLKDAAQESLQNQDQRPLESKIGSSTDSPHDYDGMFTRPRKK